MARRCQLEVIEKTYRFVRLDGALVRTHRFVFSHRVAKSDQTFSQLTMAELRSYFLAAGADASVEALVEALELAFDSVESEMESSDCATEDFQFSHCFPARTARYVKLCTAAPEVLTASRHHAVDPSTHRPSS